MIPAPATPRQTMVRWSLRATSTRWWGTARRRWGTWLGRSGRDGRDFWSLDEWGLTHEIMMIMMVFSPWNPWNPEVRSWNMMVFYSLTSCWFHLGALSRQILWVGWRGSGRWCIVTGWWFWTCLDMFGTCVASIAGLDIGLCENRYTRFLQIN